MNMEKTWIIYCHVNKLNNKRYIGQTCQKTCHRWGKSGKGYRFQNFGKVIKKYGWENFEHIILESNIKSLSEASQKEKYYIEKYDTTNPNKGYNATEGGEGELTNYSKHSIYQLDLDFNIIKKFDSLTSASNETNIPIGRIYRQCNKKGILDVRTKDKAFRWCYEEDYFNLKKEKETNKFEICQLNNSLDVIAVFKNCGEAFIKTGINPRGAIYGDNIKNGGYYWCLSSNLKNYKPREIRKRVYSKDIKNRLIVKLDPVSEEIISSYPTLVEAGKQNNLNPSTIHKNIIGLIKTAGNFKWKIIKGKQ